MFMYTKSTNRYRDVLRGPGCVILTLYYLSVSNINIVIAADEDIFIPYTDTYGYIYDPVSGQFVKGGDQQDTANKMTAENVTVVNNNESSTSINAAGSKNVPVESVLKNEVVPTSSSKDESALFYILGGGMATLILIYSGIRRVWSKK